MFGIGTVKQSCRVDRAGRGRRKPSCRVAEKGDNITEKVNSMSFFNSVGTVVFELGLARMPAPSVAACCCASKARSRPAIKELRGGSPFNIGGGFRGWTKILFFHYHPADIYFFPAAWSSNYLFRFHFGIDRFCS